MPRLQVCNSLPLNLLSPFHRTMRSKMTCHCHFLFILALLICVSLVESLHESLTVDLIHRDSPASPFHDPSLTKWTVLSNSIRRSATRAKHFRRATTSTLNFATSVVPANGEYLLNMSIGTPPVPFLGIADTGSDLTWMQCQPCEQCYRQSLPIFNPNASSSFRPLSCDSNACGLLDSRGACNDQRVCSYEYDYGDKSYTSGELATETLTFAPAARMAPSPRASVRGVVIGCGHSNEGSFNEMGSGLIGLGGGGLSLTSQLRRHIDGIFSYCLVPFSQVNSSSRMSFGRDPFLSGPGLVSTPLVKKYPDTYYYLTLEGISVGNRTFTYGVSSEEAGNGNIIIDSGTTLTLLPQELYSEVEAELSRVITGTRVDDPDNILQLCYRSVGDLDVPNITAHFSGADVVLKALNTFVRVQEDVVCFAMTPATDIAIFGNLSQMDMLVGYDVKAGRVSFLPMDCSQYQ